MSWRIVSAEATGALGSLQPLAEQVFGTGDRQPTWFGRKLVRECVDAALSQVAIRAGAAPDDPQGWIGYILVGRPPSQWPVVRAAGTGVVADWRRRGVGTALLDAAAASAAEHGAHTLELWAEREVEPFYVKRAFVVQRRLTTLLAFARGDDGREPAPNADPNDDDGLEVHAYLPEAWERSPPHERAVVRTSVPGVVHRLCREGRAVAVHRTRVQAPTLDDDAAARSLAALLDALPSPTPVLALAMPEVSSITAWLRDAGWIDIQRGTIVHRRVGPDRARPSAGHHAARAR